MEQIIENKKAKKQGGLVVLAATSIIISIILSYNSIINGIYPFSFDENWLKISNLALDSYNKDWTYFVFYKLGSSLFVLIFTLILIILFVQQSKHITNALIIFFMARILLLTLSFYLQTVIKGPTTPELVEIGSNIISSLVIPGIWIPYLMLSEKVRETFIY